MLKRPGFPTLGGWQEYWRALQHCDDWWKHDKSSRFSVLAPDWSWRGVITKCHELVQRDWSAFSRSDQDRLLGFIQDDEEDWALLGRMRPPSRQAVFGSDVTRDVIETAVKSILRAEDADFPMVAITAYQEVRQHRDISQGVASRLLTLARPDRVVSLNGGSVGRLAMYTGLTRATLDQDNNYKKLLQFIYRRPWFQTPITDLRNDLERKIWSMRAALLDSFVYRPKWAPGAYGSKKRP